MPLPEKSLTESLLWDRIGIGISGICAIHCLILPVLISLMPLWGFTSFMHGWAHPIFLLLLVPTIFYAARRSYFDRKIVGYLLSGLLLVLTGWLAGHYWFGLLFETVVTMAGSVLLITGHWLNFRHHRECKTRGHVHHPVVSKIIEPEEERTRS